MNRHPHSPVAFSRSGRVLALLAGLLVASVAVVALDRAVAGAERLSAVRQFERMACGLGLGATVAPRWCFVNFDPRLERCTCPEEPLPGGYCYCPEHDGTVTSFPAPPVSSVLQH